MNRYDLNDTHMVIYYESCAEFEKARDICLQDNNWLRDNYTKENLIIEQHSAYGVVYQSSTLKPMVMGGVFNDGRYPSDVARMFNRGYTFVDFRMTKKDMLEGFKVTNMLVNKLISVTKYNNYFISMQNRPNRKSKGYWDIWCKNMYEASNGIWNKGTGYIQTCPWNVQKCWQNFSYYERYKDSYIDWNPKTISDSEWDSLEPGK